MNFQHRLNKSLSTDQIMNKNTSKQSKENMDNNCDSKICLDFYAVGNVKKYPKLNNFQLNNSFAGGANNLLVRNYLSVSNPNFDKLTNPKKVTTIFQQIPNENNYLEPYQPYKSEHKYDIPDYGVNQGMYALMKNKLYSKNDNSNIYKGKQISRNDFMNIKKQIMNINLKTKSSSSTRVNSIRQKLLDKTKIFINPNNIKEIIREEKEKNLDDLMKEKYGPKKLVHNKSANFFQPINPVDEHHKELKSNDSRFNINHNHILKSRNWWKVE